MNRIGFNCCHGDPSKDIERSLTLEGLRFEGLFTHFAVADLDGDPTGEYTEKQYERYILVSKKLENDGFFRR